MRTEVKSEKLKTLFQAFRDKNDGAFIRAAETIINDELAANHHYAATELQQSLGPRAERMNTAPKPIEMSSLPKDRRAGEDLIWIKPSIAPQQVIFTKQTETRIQRVLEEHRRRNRLLENGYRPKTKLLFWGPPGTGKTLTASYLGYELGLPVGVLRLNSVISSFLGDTAAHLQRVFSRLENSPMVLLLDEVDAIGKDRDDPNDVGELKRVVNGLLQMIDAFQSSNSILVAASNHQYLLDPALWRRFDDVIHFPLPTLEDRKRLLKSLLAGVSVQGSVPRLASKMNGLSFADIEQVLVETIKTMLLEDRSTLRLLDAEKELEVWRSAVRNARRKYKRNGTHES